LLYKLNDMKTTTQKQRKFKFDKGMSILYNIQRYSFFYEMKDEEFVEVIVIVDDLNNTIEIADFVMSGMFELTNEEKQFIANDLIKRIKSSKVYLPRTIIFENTNENLFRNKNTYNNFKGGDWYEHDIKKLNFSISK
jgi:hypothetical protein